MVARDRNHPSVIIWSIGNEIADAGNHTAAQSLIAAVKTQDTSRVDRPGVPGGEPGPRDRRRWRTSSASNYAPYAYDSLHSANPTWKFFASESSSAVRSRGVYKLPASQNILTSSDNQCSSYDNSVVSWGASAESSWQSVNSRAFIAGEFIWTGFDYIGEPTPYGWPSKSSYFGAIDTAGFAKDIFYFYQSRWNYAGPTMVHIVPMDWTSWTAGQSVPVYVYSNADSVELFLNGTSLGLEEHQPSPVAGGLRAPSLDGALRQGHAPGEGHEERYGRRDRHGADRRRRPRPSSSPPTVRRSPRTEAISAYVEVDIVDASGVVVPQAANVVTFSVTGAGALAGVDNGDSTSHEAYTGTTRSAFSGKALAILRSTKTPGTVTLQATSGALTGASVQIATHAL